MSPHSDFSTDDVWRDTIDASVMKANSDRRKAAEREAVLAALTDCRAALERSLTDLRADAARHHAVDAVQPSIAQFASVMADHRLPPERMIVMLKRSVSLVPAVRQLLQTDRDELSHELVEMAIAAYYQQADRR